MNSSIAKYLFCAFGVYSLIGCASPVDKTAESPYCHTDRSRNYYCTSFNAPSIKADEESKNFSSSSDALTIYIVRYWGDGHHPLSVSVNDAASIATVPNSMIRVRLGAGAHKISFNVDGKNYERNISGRLGEVKFLGIDGSDVSFGVSEHRWSNDSDSKVREKAVQSRLIKDLSIK